MTQPFEQLEIELAAWAGCEPEQMVVCSTGSAALHLALEAMKLPQGSEVLVPDFTFIACARAVTLAGLKPRFIDCNELLLTADEMVKHWCSLSKVVMPVHVYGRRCDMDKIHSWKLSTIRVVEDLAEAHGIKPHPNSDAACWSFYKNKIIAGEEGGAVAFRSPEQAAYARLLRSQGNRGDWVHVPRAMNYRMTNDAATRILASLRMFDHNIRARREIEAEYDCLCPAEWRMPPRDAPWVYDLRIPELPAKKQLQIINALRKAGIEARCGFKPLSCQPEYGKVADDRMRWEWLKLGVMHTDNSNALLAAREVIALPIQPGVTRPAQIHLSLDTIQRVLG
jgi:dTDP-4-amino-4,6-dideoxygalactose transaminase